eukprot:Rmarinus@m.29521
MSRGREMLKKIKETPKRELKSPYRNPSDAKRRKSDEYSLGPDTNGQENVNPAHSNGRPDASRASPNASRASPNASRVSPLNGCNATSGSAVDPAPKKSRTSIYTIGSAYANTRPMNLNDIFDDVPVHRASSSLSAPSPIASPAAPQSRRGSGTLHSYLTDRPRHGSPSPTKEGKEGRASHPQTVSPIEVSPKRWPLRQSNWSNSTSERSRRGLKNLGNSCYMNAVLHPLSKLSPFVHDLKHFCNAASGSSPVSDELLRVLLQLREENSIVVPRELRRELLRKSQCARNFDQQDSAEFFLELLAILNSEFRSACPGDKSPKSSYPTDLNFRCIVEYRNECSDCQLRSISRELLPVLPLDLGSVSEVSVIPQCCGPCVRHVATTGQVSYSCSKCSKSQLEGDVRGNKRALFKYIDEFFKPEEVECTCARCGGRKRKIAKGFRLLPRVLAVHLKRFTLTGDKVVKRTDSVCIQKELDLNELCWTDCEAPPRIPDDTSNGSDVDARELGQSSKSSDPDLEEAIRRSLQDVSGDNEDFF